MNCLLAFSFERQYFKNSYLRGPYGYYRYDSMDDFMQGKVPTIYGITYGYNGNDAPGLELTFWNGWCVCPRRMVSYS